MLTVYFRALFAEDVVDLVSPGVLCYSDVERIHKVQLHATHADAAGDQDVRAWQNDPTVLDNTLFVDPDARIGAFIENSRGSTCALIGDGDTFFVLDSHGFDAQTGHKCGRDGRAIIVRIEGVSELFRFLRSLVSEGQSITLTQVYM